MLKGNKSLANRTILHYAIKRARSRKEFQWCLLQEAFQNKEWMRSLKQIDELTHVESIRSCWWIFQKECLKDVEVTQQLNNTGMCRHLFVAQHMCHYCPYRNMNAVSPKRKYYYCCLAVPPHCHPSAKDEEIHVSLLNSGKDHHWMPKFEDK